MNNLPKHSLSVGLIISVVSFFLFVVVAFTETESVTVTKSQSHSIWSKLASYIWDDVGEERSSVNISQINKTIERGIKVNDLGVEELYNAYKSIQDEYSKKAFQCESESTSYSSSLSRKKMNKYDQCNGKWRLIKSTNDGVEVSMLNHPSDPTCPYVKMEAIMPGSLQDVWDFLALSNWDETMPKMDPFYEGLDIVKVYSDAKPKTMKKDKQKRMSALFGRTSKKKKKKSDNSVSPPEKIEITLARKKTKRILTFGKRDFTFVQVSDLPLDDGTWVSGTVSIISDEIPRAKQYTRAFQDSVAFYEELSVSSTTKGYFKKGEPRTKLTIVCRIDLNDSAPDGTGEGNIPMFLYVKTIGSTGVLSINNMRKELRKGLDLKE